MRRKLPNVSGSVHDATLRSLRRIADGTFEFVLALDEADLALRWRAGQFVSLRCGTTAEGEPLLRSYSIASSPGSGVVTLIIKLIEGGAASTWLSRLGAGDRVQFTGPMGFFVLELAHPGDAVFAATGVGIAPVLPMVRETLARAETGRVLLRWGCRHEGDLFWQEELAALAAAAPRLDVVTYVSQPAATWTGARGRINPEIVASAPSLARPTFYLVGNGAMIRELKTQLVALGVDRKRQIRTEAFFD
jgi:CDP-4-dehydro-6-deoxyglucose reductase, E3